MKEILLTIINYLLNNSIALVALLFSIFLYFKISSVQTKLNIEPVIRILLPSDLSETNLPVYIENIGRANVKQDITTWRQPHFTDIQKELNELMVR